MFNNFLSLFLLSTIAVLSKAQFIRGNCRTPDNRIGICVPVRSCNSLSQLLNQILFPDVTKYLQDSKCGNRTNEACCPDAEITPPSSTQRSTTRTTPRRPLIRISVKKCSEYAESAYDNTHTIGSAIVTKRSNCALGIGLVVGGTEAKQREFPHMDTNIKKKLTWWWWHTYKGPAKYVRLGEHNLERLDDATHIDFNIAEEFVHQNVSSTTFNDIILFKLDRVVLFNNAIRPACLPEQFEVPNNVTVTGWGDTQEGGNTSNVLRKAELETFSREEWIKTTIGQQYRNYVGTIVFAGHHTNSMDACQGDSGGPLQIPHKTHHCTYTVVGVTANGILCGLIGLPAVYVHVKSHLSWIESTVWPNE